MLIALVGFFDEVGSSALGPPRPAGHSGESSSSANSRIPILRSTSTPNSSSGRPNSPAVVRKNDPSRRVALRALPKDVKKTVSKIPTKTGEKMGAVAARNMDVEQNGEMTPHYGDVDDKDVVAIRRKSLKLTVLDTELERDGCSI
jgi:hypothetical protein